MKKLYLLLLFIAQNTILFAQDMTFDWIHVWDNQSGADIYPEFMAIDGQRNIYVNGVFNGTADFDPGPGVFTLTSAGKYYNKSTFVAKFNTEGSFIWANYLYTTTGKMRSTGITSDAEGNTYVTGYYTDTLYFVQNGVTMKRGSATNYEDVFIAKLDSTGAIQYVKSYGSIYDDKPGSVAVDAAGNLYATGYFYDSVWFEAGNPASLVNTYLGYDLYVVKFNPAGDFQWVKTINDTTASMSINPVAIATSGSMLYVTGGYYDYNGDSIDFDPGPDVLNFPSGNGNTFLMAFDTSGNYKWAKNYGTPDAYEYPADVVARSNGNALLVSKIGSGTSDFDPSGSEGEVTWPTYPGLGFFVLELDPDGNFVRVIPFHPSMHNTQPNSIALDGDDNIIMQGYFNGTMDFDPGPGTFNLTQKGWASNDIFILKLDPSGNFIWAASYHTPGTDSGKEMVADEYGNAYGAAITAAGSASDTINLGNRQFINSGQMRFIYKLIPCGSAVVHQPNDSTLYADAVGASYQWLDCNNGYAPLPGDTLRYFVPEASGHYAVKITNYGCVDTSDCFFINRAIAGSGGTSFGDRWRVYPNPTQGTVFIDLGAIYEKLTLRITSATGQLVEWRKIEKAQHIEWQIRGAAGLYLVEISDENNHRTALKIIKK